MIRCMLLIICFTLTQNIMSEPLKCSLTNPNKCHLRFSLTEKELSDYETNLKPISFYFNDTKVYTVYRYKIRSREKQAKSKLFKVSILTLGTWHVSEELRLQVLEETHRAYTPSGKP